MPGRPGSGVRRRSRPLTPGPFRVRVYLGVFGLCFLVSLVVALITTYG